MNRIVCCCIVVALMMLTPSLRAQKSNIVDQAEPSGKQAIKEEAPRYSPPPETESKPERSYESYSEPAYTPPAPAYSAPEPAYSPPEPAYTPPAPTYSEPKSSYSEPEPAEESPKPKRWETQSTPRSTTTNEVSEAPAASPKPKNPATGAASLPAAESATTPSKPRVVTFEDGSHYNAKPNNEPLPGIRPTPLPPAVVPQPRGGGVMHDGTLTTLDDDTTGAIPGPIGVLLSESNRPDYQVLEVSQIISLPPTHPKPLPFSTRPTTTPPTQTGGGYTGGSDPYDQNNNTNDYTSTTTVWAAEYSSLPPELACVYAASDSLVSLYRDPQWCVPVFDQAYEQMLLDYKLCYRGLSPNLIETWMWPCYLTFADERNFWNEECFNGDPDLQAVRNFMREKAIYIPYLMVDVDAKSLRDWAYVDTAFGSPYGGNNYYETMRTFAPGYVLQQLKSWTRQYPAVLEWPSYAALQTFYAEYFRSDLWLMLRTKAKLDYDSAVSMRANQPEAAFQMASNAAWLCLALLSVEPKDEEVNHTKGELKNFLRQDTRWASSDLRDLMN